MLLAAIRRSVSLGSGNIHSKAFLRHLSSNQCGMAKIEELAIFLLPYLQRFQIEVNVIVYYHGTLFGISDDTNKDVLE